MCMGLLGVVLIMMVIDRFVFCYLIDDIVLCRLFVVGGIMVSCLGCMYVILLCILWCGLLSGKIICGGSRFVGLR